MQLDLRLLDTKKAVNMDYKYKDLFLEDSVHKSLELSFEDGTIIENKDICSEEMEITESICSEPSLKFGCCESSCLKIKIANQFESKFCMRLTVSEILDKKTDATFTLGTYKVVEDKPTADRIFRELTCYDAMYDILNANVKVWYDRTLPNNDSEVTLKVFRTSFFRELGIEQEDVVLPNDSMKIQRTIETDTLSGATVIQAICEINGCFGHISRDNKFQYISLESPWEYLTDETKNQLTDENGFYLVSAKNQIESSHYKTCQYEDFSVSKITGVSIRNEENDIGARSGSDENRYIIENNFLCYGKGTQELTEIAINILERIENITYIPATIEAKGNPCTDVGSPIVLHTKYATINTYILQRTLRGIQSLSDTYVAEGTQDVQNNENSFSSEIRQIRGKTNKFTRDLEATKFQIDEFAEEVINNYPTNVEMQSIIEQTVENIKLEVSKTYTEQSVFDNAISELQNLIDGTKKQWFLAGQPTLWNEPAVNWTTTEEKEFHVGDTYFDTNTNFGYRFLYNQYADYYSWERIVDNDAVNALKKANEALKNAQAIADNLKTNYSTTTEVKSAITTTADSIKSEVSETYSTKSDLKNLDVGTRNLIRNSVSLIFNDYYFTDK